MHAGRDSTGHCPLDSQRHISGVEIKELRYVTWFQTKIQTKPIPQKRYSCQSGHELSAPFRLNKQCSGLNIEVSDSQVPIFHRKKASAGISVQNNPQPQCFHSQTRLQPHLQLCEAVLSSGLMSGWQNAHNDDANMLIISGCNVYRFQH